MPLLSWHSLETLASIDGMVWLGFFHQRVPYQNWTGIVCYPFDAAGFLWSFPKECQRGNPPVRRYLQSRARLGEIRARPAQQIILAGRDRSLAGMNFSAQPVSCSKHYLSWGSSNPAWLHPDQVRACLPFALSMADLICRPTPGSSDLP